MGWFRCEGVRWRDQFRAAFWAAISALAIVGADMWLTEPANQHSMWRLPVAIAPVIPATLYVYEQMRSIWRLDELQRRIHYEGLAITFGAAAVLGVLYGSLQAGRFVPPVSWQTMWFGMVALWTISYVVAAWRYR